jgi:hypothetical protein
MLSRSLIIHLHRQPAKMSPLLNPRNYWSAPLLRKSHRFHDTHQDQQTFHTTKGFHASTLSAAERVLRYVATQTEASVIFHKSDMGLSLICYSDASYLSESEARSRCGGLFYLGGTNVSILNGPILCRSSIIDVVTSSAAESEFAAAFMNAKEAAYIRNTLQSLGYQQGPTPVITDNSFVHSVVTGSCKQKDHAPWIGVSTG